MWMKRWSGVVKTRSELGGVKARMVCVMGMRMGIGLKGTMCVCFWIGRFLPSLAAAGGQFG